MVRLSDLVNVEININKIKIQGVEIPVIFSFESFPYVEESYGKPYHEFEKEMNDMVKQGSFSLGEKEAKLMRSLIYAMVRSGGTECTPTEIKHAIPLYDVPGIFQVVWDIFNNQNFQTEDMEKLKKDEKK
ncbi:phage protein [Bacillus cereus NVH0597-99]|nr:phage protein [Bacillus cereus NVH0597-99]